ncbi:DUF397 domain-containing protein [Saccharopolyspora sp. HNM0983]|uniref:DUF397 domain-containing protein n=1 Tax=Saccharopolyspora montiporae TaxID=2781240 RepID=A0A929BBE3_9PSEU|nr:DUF397 domain-containing protein [Saccharopolyspora sp. HNM0983]
MWRKSSRSGSATKCVEVASLSDGVAVRDSKDAAGPRVRVRSAGWAVFLAALRAGRFDQG